MLADARTVFLDDHFMPFALAPVDAIGFRRRGEVTDFVTIENLSIGGCDQRAHPGP